MCIVYVYTYIYMYTNYLNQKLGKISHELEKEKESAWEEVEGDKRKNYVILLYINFK